MHIDYTMQFRTFDSKKLEVNLKEDSLGSRVRFFRQRAKMSQLDLELTAELSTGAVSRIENNVIVPTWKSLLKIVWALSLDIHERSSFFDEALYK